MKANKSKRLHDAKRWIEEHEDVREAAVRQRVVRNGYLSERTILTKSLPGDRR